MKIIVVSKTFNFQYLWKKSLTFASAESSANCIIQACFDGVV